MEIVITTVIKSRERWDEKRYGVVLIDKIGDSTPVFRYLCKQDEYWRNYRNLIQLRPEVMDNEKVVKNLCSYTGKTGIYDMPKFMEEMKKLNIDVFVYQYEKDCDC